MTARLRFAGMATLCVALFFLAGCAATSRVGTYPNPNGPRNGDGALVDPKTGVTLPGQAEGGGGAR
jgi:hypothetical protein